MSKLNEAKQLVDELKRKAAEQSQLLAEKQSEADQALGQITESMQVRPLLVHLIEIVTLDFCTYVDEVRVWQGFDYIPIFTLNIWTHDS